MGVEKGIVKELLIKAKKGELEWDEVRTGLGHGYTARYKWHTIELRASDYPGISEVPTCFTLSVDSPNESLPFYISGQNSVEAKDADPIFGPLLYGKNFEDTGGLSGIRYSLKKQGPYKLLKELYSLVEKEQKEKEWMQNSSIDVIREILEKLAKTSIKTHSAAAIQRAIINGLSEKLKEIVWSVGYEDGSKIYIAFFREMELRLRNFVGWIRLIVKTSQGEIYIYGWTRNGYLALIPGEKTELYDLLDDLHKQIGKRLVYKSYKAEIKEKAFQFMRVLRNN